MNFADMDYLTIGEIFEMIIESGNDHEDYDTVRNATQADIEKLKRM